MSSSISPILAAYFGGQKQQTDLITQAREISDAQVRQQQAQEELKQRQATIDEIARQHLVENKHSQDQLELSHQIAADTHQLHLNEATRDMIQQLRQNNIDPSQTSLGLPRDMTVPGLPIPTSPGALPQRTPNGVTLPNIQPKVVNPTQTINVPGFGPQQVPAWQTEAQSDAAKAAALLPSKVNEYQQTIGNTNQQKLEQQMQRLQDTLNSRESQAEQQRELQKQLADIRVGQAENAANHRISQFYMSAGLPLDLDAAHKMIAGYAADELTGKGTGNPRTAYGPVVGNLVTQAIANQGGRVMPSKTRDTVMGMANDVTQTLNTLQQLKDSVPVPHNLTGQISNVLADKFGIYGLSPYKSIFDALQTSIVPKLDTVLGFTPGTLSRSPKLYEKLKSITPLPGDAASLVEQKTANAADVFLSAISKQLSGYGDKQRAAIWQEIANDHPELINSNKGIRQKLFQAGSTGTYTPGEGYALFTNQGGK